MNSGRCEDHVDVKTASLTIEGTKLDVDIYGVKFDWVADASRERHPGQGSHGVERYLKCHITMPPGKGDNTRPANQGSKTIVLEIPGRQNGAAPSADTSG
jgi:hypothetical protein